MSYWLYQINQKLWDPGRFRIEVWEGERWSWAGGKVQGGEKPHPGDSVAFFCARTGGDDPGFFGWAVALEWHEDHEGKGTLYFRPAAPTNHLKMHPWWNDEAQALADEIREPMMQATLFPVLGEQWRRIRTGITTWVSGRGLELKLSSVAGSTR
jgi:hypothetical protein